MLARGKGSVVDNVNGNGEEEKLGVVVSFGHNLRIFPGYRTPDLPLTFVGSSGMAVRVQSSTSDQISHSSLHLDLDISLLEPISTRSRGLILFALFTICSEYFGKSKSSPGRQQEQEQAEVGAVGAIGASAAPFTNIFEN